MKQIFYLSRFVDRNCAPSHLRPNYVLDNFLPQDYTTRCVCVCDAYLKIWSLMIGYSPVTTLWTYEVNHSVKLDPVMGYIGLH